MSTGTEGNRRRSSRRRTPKVEWDSNQSTDDEIKTSNLSLRSVGRRTTSKSLYGFSRSSVAGLRKLQKNGQRVKGTDLLAKMNERRNKMSRGKSSSRQKRKKDKVSVEDEQTASGSTSGFAIPLSILNNIPDIGLCSLEGQTGATSEPLEAGKLCDTASGSDNSSSSSQPSSRRATTTSKKFRERTISPEVALQNEMNLPAGVSIINNNGVNHTSHEGLSSAVLSRALDSCQYDFAHNTTKAPILWAYDNMADVLNENTTDSVEKAREILTRWKKVPSTVKTLYLNKAESSGKRKKNLLNSNQSSSTRAKNSCNNVAVSSTPFYSKISSSLSSNLSAPQPHDIYSHTPTPPITQHDMGVMNAYALTRDSSGSLPTDCGTFWPPHPSTDVSTISNPTTPLYALTSSSSNFIKLLASVPVTMSNADGSGNGSTQSRNVGIPIVRMSNPLFPNTPPPFFFNQQPIFSPLPNSPSDNKGFSITNILANTLPNNISSSPKMPNTLNPNSNGGKKKSRRQSPYRVKTNPPNSLPIRNVNHFNDSKDCKSKSPVQNSNTATTGSLPLIKRDPVTPPSNNVPNGRDTPSSTTQRSPSNSSQSNIALCSNSSVAASTSCPVVPSSLTVVTDEWKRTLEKQLRANKVAKTDQSRLSSSSKSKPISPDPLKMTRVLADDRKKRKKSNVLSRFPMKALKPSTLNEIAVSPLATSPDLPIAMSPMLPQRSPLASPPLHMPFPSPLIGNAFKSPLGGFTPIPVQTPILRANSPVLFASGQFMTASTPSPASTPSMLSGEVLKGSVIDLSNKGLLTPEEQTKVDARNYADLERQYWRSLLAFEDQKRIIADLKERLVKARAEQQVLLLGDEKFNHLKEMVVSPVWKPVVPDLLNDLAESSHITSEVRLKGSFDKPILENEDVYKYLLQSLS